LPCGGPTFAEAGGALETGAGAGCCGSRLNTSPQEVEVGAAAGEGLEAELGWL
jgi:hypothetical protein